MVVDTPLARLDSLHRGRLMERYFPTASHQVIILSTDTEVDRSYFEALKPSMSHALYLTSHPDAWTEVRPGYFWREDADANTAA